MVKVGRYDYKKSTSKGKKLMVVIEKGGKKKTIHFGDSNMQQFKDKTGIWKSKDHGDAERRKSYRSRHGGILKKDGSKAINDPMSAAYHSYRVLW
jgi:hypothetical protein